DYISKPFDKELLKARVTGILKSKNNLQKYFYNEITLNSNSLKISSEYKEFLDNCISIVEQHITDPDFNIQSLAAEIGMSRSNLYKRIKSISGQSSNSFIRFIRLRKAAEIFINTDNTILETSYMVGISDPKYFREQFNKLFNMNPSQYIKRYRKSFSNNLSVSANLRRSAKK
ncbi:MAG: AraC family transcriptional regulator, partial [Sphingobacteriales bacterium]